MTREQVRALRMAVHDVSANSNLGWEIDITSSSNLLSNESLKYG